MGGAARTLHSFPLCVGAAVSPMLPHPCRFEEGIQHKVNGQWILYKKHMGKGYTKSKTISITRSDGQPDTELNTEWGQKGRMLIHEILTRRGIMAAMDKTA